MELGVCLVKPATWIQTRCSSVASAGLCVCGGGGGSYESCGVGAELFTTVFLL